MIPEFTLPTDWDHDCSELYHGDEEFSAASTEVSMIYEQFQMEEEDDEEEDLRAADTANSSSCLTMMEVDDVDDYVDPEQILGVSNLLLLDDDEIFHDPCLPPINGGMEYLESISIDDRFSLSLLEEEIEGELLQQLEIEDEPQPPPQGKDDPGATTTSLSSSTTTTSGNKEGPPLPPVVVLEQQERYKIMLDRLAESMRRSQETRKSLTIHTIRTQDLYNQERRKSLTGVLSSVEKSTSAIQERLLHSALS
jgi:hypothetical protein